MTVRNRLLLTMLPAISDLYLLGGLNRLHRLQRLHHLVDLPARIRRTPRAAPSVVHLLFAGLAVFAFVKLMSAANRGHRSRPTALAIGILLLAVGAVIMSLRRSARRYYR